MGKNRLYLGVILDSNITGIRIMTISLDLTHKETLFINVETLSLDKLIFNRIAIIMYKYTNYMLPSVSLC